MLCFVVLTFWNTQCCAYILIYMMLCLHFGNQVKAALSHRLSSPFPLACRCLD